MQMLIYLQLNFFFKVYNSLKFVKITFYI